MDNKNRKEIKNPSSIGLNNENDQASLESEVSNLEYSVKKRPNVQALKFTEIIDGRTSNASIPSSPTSSTPSSPVMGLAKKIFGVTSDTMRK